MKDEDKKGLLKRLKNIEKNQNSNNNNKNKKTNDKSNLSSGSSESISNDELERSVYCPDVANMKGIDILKLGDETKTSVEYIKNSIELFFWFIKIFLIQI